MIHFFLGCSSFCSLFVQCFFVRRPFVVRSLVRSLFVRCSFDIRRSFVRLSCVRRSFIVRSLFVVRLFACRAFVVRSLFVCCSFVRSFIYLFINSFNLSIHLFMCSSFLPSTLLVSDKSDQFTFLF